MNERKKNIVSLTLNAITVCFVVYSVFLCAFVFLQENDEEILLGSGIRSFGYFTVLSNLFAGITAAIAVVYSALALKGKISVFPKFLSALKFASTVAVSLTFFTVLLFLEPVVMSSGRSFFWLYTHSNMFNHFINPLLAMVTFFCFDLNGELPFKYTFLCLVPTVLYSILYITMVVFIGKENGGWADFYNFTFGGRMWMAPISTIVMYGATYLIAYVEWRLQRKLNRAA